MQNVIFGRSQTMKVVKERLDEVAHTDIPILLEGETGTGKNLLAKYIHDLSPRKESRFVIVDGATLSGNLMESELFGHEKGSFTGAGSAKIGRLELAHSGTLFLNEAQNLSLDTQAKLLEVVENGTFYRVGGHQEIHSSFRLIAATNRNLDKLISAGRFREDFYYRLEHAVIRLPPLRERREDILLLVECFLQKFNQSTGKSALLSDEAKELLLHYHWPGNIRELSNKIEHAVAFCQNSILLPKDFNLNMRREALLLEVMNNGGNMLEEMERRLIVMVLEEVNYNLTQASTMLGIGRNTLKRKMEAYKLGRNDDVQNG